MKQFLRYIFAITTILMVVVGDMWGTVLNSTTTQDLNNNTIDRDYKYFTLSGQGDVISFNYKLKKDASTTTHNIFVEVSFDNNNWFEIQKYETKSSSDQSASNIKIPHARIRYLRIGLGTAGSQDAQIWNVKVTKRRTPNNIVPFTIDSHDRFWLDFYYADNNNSMRWDNGVRLGSADVGSDAANSDDRYFVIALTCIPGTLSFDYERTVSIATGCDWYVEESPDAQNWDRTWSATANEGNHSYDLKESTKYIKFCYSGNYGGRFKNIKVTESSYANQPGPGVTSWDAGTDIIGNPVQAEVNMAWSNTTFTWELVDNTDSQFTVSFSNTGATCEYGTSTITGTYLRTKPGNHSATLKIYTISGNYEIELSGTTGKYTPLAEKKQDLIMGTTYDPSEVFKVYYKANNVETPISDYSITALDPTIANYINGQIVTYYQTGTARFLISRQSNDTFYELNETISIDIKPSEEICYVLDDVNGGSYSAAGGGNYTPAAFIGTPYQLTFKAYASGSNTAVGDVEVQQFIDGNWQTIKNLQLTSSEQDYGPYDITSTATQIRFYSDAGSYSRYFKNVRVTRKTFLEPQIDGETFYLTQVSSGMQFAGTFPLAWSTCSENIRFSCDNPNFTILPAVIDASNGQDTTSIVITYSADAENPDLTGTLTIYDQSQTKTITLSCEHLLQTIEWPQYFYNLEADENGDINEDIELNAVAKSVNGYPTSQPITYTLNVSPANASLSTDANGNTHLNITGICEGTITASVSGFTDSNGRTYSASSLTREIRIRKAGDPCDSYALSIVNEQSTHGWGTNYLVFPISGLPESTMTFGAHADVGSINNYLYIDFHTDANAAPDAAGWSNRQTIEVKADDKQTWGYTCTVPADAKQVRFETVSSLNTYFDMVTIYQKEYLTADVERIDLPNTTVNQQFTASFAVDYSDVPFIQYQVTNSNNLNLQLTPSPEINNNCGEYGTYAFTLTGMSPYPQENVQETITIFTSAGHHVEIPVIITSRLSDTYYFNQIDGDWNNLENWRVNNAVPTHLPTPSNPVIISKAASIGTNDTPFEGTAYSIDIQQGGSITVLPKGGLTVHAGGFTGASEQNLTIHNTQSGAGFIRISPYFTKEVTGTMPKAKVLYQTKSTLDTGANKDATWQYIGAPGTDCSISVDYNTWLYKLDESNADWVLQPRTADVALEPFEGYAITQYGQPTYQWTAQLTNQSHALPLTYSKAGRSGRHIFANSFAAPIDVKQLSGLITYADGQDSRFRIEQTVYIFNSGSWNAWNTKPQMGDDTPGQYYAIPILAAAADYLADEQTVIPPMQGFYMRVRSRIPTSELSATENVGQILLDYNKLVMGNQHELNTPLRLPQRVEETPDFQRVRMYATSANSGADRLYIIQDTINTRKYNNGYDAPNQETKGLVNIYTNESFGKMEVSCSDNIDSLYIGFMAGEDSNYTLHFGALCGEIYLKDLENDSIFLMQDGGQYSFTATPNSTNDLRFQILLHPDIDPFPGNGDINSSINNIPSMQVWMDDNTIYIANAPINSVATLFNISGHAVLTTPIRYTPYSLNLSHMPQGVYVLKINNEAYKFVCK